MFLSPLLFLILGVYGLLAAESDHEGRYEGSDRNDFARNKRSDALDSTTKLSLGTDSVAEVSQKRMAEAPEESKMDELLLMRSLPDSENLDSYVADNFTDNELLYAIYDYDGGANDENLHLIDPKSLASSPVPDASKALLRQINETTS